jgi:ubiquinone/menaquinone biosynthesis C-methylase UbiE
MSPPDAVRSDFDRLALLDERYAWSHNDHYHGFLLRHVPSPCAEALEIGCGTGTFSRALAERAGHVLALDLSPQMVRIARERSHSHPNVEYLEANALDWEWPVARFDCVVSIATLHHLPPAEMLEKMRRALRPGGTLLVLDLYRQEGPVDLLTNIPAIPANLALRLLHTRRLTVPREIAHAWAEHGKHDTYLTLRQLGRICRATIPGAQVRRHLLWRYSIVWKSP